MLDQFLGHTELLREAVDAEAVPGASVDHSPVDGDLVRYKLLSALKAVHLHLHQLCPVNLAAMGLDSGEEGIPPYP